MLTLPHFQFIYALMGAERILFSVDYPYQTLDGVKTFIVASRQMHFLKLLRTCFLSIRKQKSSVQRQWKKMLAQYLQAWLNSLLIHSSWISGKDPR